MVEGKRVPPPATDSTSLSCAARILGFECADANLDFLRCKEKDQDPRACLPQGERVTACVLKTLREVEDNCGDKFAAYQKAMKKKWGRLEECRKEEAALETCWREYKGYSQEQS